MRDQVRFLHFVDAHVEIDVLANEIDPAVDGVERDVERWIALRQQRQSRRDVLASEPKAGGDTQRPPWVQPPAGYGFTHVLDALEDLLRRCIHAFAVVGHRDAPSGAMEERNAERLLEDRDALADESRR